MAHYCLGARKGHLACDKHLCSLLFQNKWKRTAIFNWKMVITTEVAVQHWILS